MSAFRVLGNDAKLVPNNGKLEVRRRGPNVTPGYWRPAGTYRRAPSTRKASTSSAMRSKLVDSNNLDAGFDFDGRIAEDFKLASGTWVSVGAAACASSRPCAPLVRDVVIAGINRDDIAALVVLDLDGCRLINPTLPADDPAVAAG